MPRIDTHRGLSLPYRPGNPAGPGASQEEQMRAVWEELNRIAITTAAIDQPASAAAQVGGLFPVTATEIWTRLYDGDFTFPPWSRPPDAYDTTTGIYTVQDEGLYTSTTEFNVEPFPVPGIRVYYLGLRLTVVPVVGPPNELYAHNGGNDTVAGSVTMAITGSLVEGTQLYWDGTIVHDSTTGDVGYSGTMSILRVSGTGDNTA
jgi:hypothetical protein